MNRRTFLASTASSIAFLNPMQAHAIWHVALRFLISRVGTYHVNRLVTRRVAKGVVGGAGIAAVSPSVARAATDIGADVLSGVTRPAFVEAFKDYYFGRYAPKKSADGEMEYPIPNDAPILTQDLTGKLVDGLSNMTEEIVIDVDSRHFYKDDVLYASLVDIDTGEATNMGSQIVFYPYEMGSWPWSVPLTGKVKPGRKTLEIKSQENLESTVAVSRVVFVREA